MHTPANVVFPFFYLLPLNFFGFGMCAIGKRHERMSQQKIYVDLSIKRYSVWAFFKKFYYQIIALPFSFAGFAKVNNK